jgi:hypothetical protein
MSDRLRRLAPLTGIPFAILLIVTFNLADSPGLHSTGTHVIQYYNDHKNRNIIGDLCGALGVVFFLFFITSLRSYFKDKGGGADGLSMAALVGGIFIGVGGAIFTSLDIALIDARHDISPQAVQALNVLNNDLFFPFEIGLVVFSLSIGLAIIASGALPKWLGWVMVVIGVVALSPVGFFGFFAVLIWSLIVSIAIYRRTGPTAAAPATT